LGALVEQLGQQEAVVLQRRAEIGEALSESRIGALGDAGKVAAHRRQRPRQLLEVGNPPLEGVEPLEGVGEVNREREAREVLRGS
jgi:hypothetical protein